MIDFHCHIDLYPEPEQVIKRCTEQGIDVLSVTTTPSAWRGTSALSPKGTRIRTALGLHPELAHERIGELHLFDETLPETRYVGEIGLDGSPELQKHWHDQTVVFEHILDSCRKAGGRILSIHSRRASQAVLDRLANYNGAGIPVLHWFSGSLRDLERAVELGCWFSVGPAMLRSRRGVDLVTRIPRDRILTESDGPFVQLDGGSLMPWDVSKAFVHLGNVWSVDAEMVQVTLAKNLHRLVRLTQ